MASLSIPLLSGGVVDIQLEQLTQETDANDIITLLTTERAPPQLWLSIAMNYYRFHGTTRPDLFEQICLTAIELFPWPTSTSSLSQQDSSALISLHNVLVASLLSRTNNANSPSLREQLLSKCVFYTNSVERIGPSEASWVNRGFLYMEQKDPQRASEQFSFVLENLNPSSGPAFSGQAVIFFQKEKFNEALALFQKALKASPQSSAVRYGIAICAQRLGMNDLAQAALSRAMLFSKQNHNPSIALESAISSAILEVNKGNFKNAMETFKLCATNSTASKRSQHPVVLNHLANHFFYHGDLNKSFSFATAAKECCSGNENDHIRAESLFLIGRVYHSLGQFDLAQAQYTMSLMTWPEFILPEFYLGQMFLIRNELEKAAASFDKVIAQNPDNSDALCCLGAVCARIPSRKSQAIGFATRASELRPFDPQPLLDIAKLTDISTPKGMQDALGCYNKAIQLLAANGNQVSQEIWNNFGVLQHHSGLISEAETSLLKAIEVSGAKIEEYAEKNIPTTFNLARLYESKRDDSKAESLYKGILREHPTYVDCFLRLGMMARARGLFSDAAEWVKSVFMSQPNHIGAFSLMGTLHFDREEWGQAQKWLDKVNKTPDGHALVALANVYYCAKFGIKEKDRAARYLHAAKNFYLQALKLDNKNVFAANGLGIILAELGELEAAMKAFIQVKDATVDVPDVHTNLGHGYMMQGHYQAAIHMYEAYLHHSQQQQNKLQNETNINRNNEVAVLLYLANAQFEFHKFPECQKTLQSAIRMMPYNLILWFNLALCSEEASSEAYHSSKDKIKSILETSTNVLASLHDYVTEMKSAVANAKLALSIFSWLETAKPILQSIGGVNYKHNQQRAGHHCGRCRNLIDSTKVACNAAEEAEKVESERRKEELRKLNESNEENRKRQEEARKVKEEEERLNELYAEKELQRQKELAMQLNEESKKDSDESTKRQTRKNKNQIVEEVIEEGEDDNNRQKQQQEQERNEDGAAADEEDDDEMKKKRAVARTLEKIRQSKRAREEKKEEEENEESGHKKHKKHKHHHHKHKHSNDDDDNDDEEEQQQQEEEKAGEVVEYKRRLRKVTPEQMPSPEIANQVKEEQKPGEISSEKKEEETGGKVDGVVVPMASTTTSTEENPIQNQDQPKQP